MLRSKENIAEVVEKMTLDQKLGLLVGGKGFASLAIPELGITEMSMCDGHNGINLMQKMVDIIPMVLAQVAQDNTLTVGRDEIISYIFAISKAAGGMQGTVKLLKGQLTDEDFSRMDLPVAEFAKQFIEALPKVLPGGKLPTAYPVGMNMATTWNRELMEKCGELVGIESKAYGVDILLAPNINIQRDPLCGRWFESFSEDPYVTAELVKPYINGVQSTGVLADVKHYVANNQETLRHEIDEIIPERALREIYLPGFKAALVDANSETVMTAYNSVNGEFCTENDFILKKVLREDWGYEGLVLSDWNAVYNKVEALKAGNNLEMPGPNDQTEIKEAIESGELSMELIDEHITKILEAVVKTNGFKGEKLDTFDCEAHGAFSKEMAAESIVLLKNDDMLPLADDKLAVFGSYAGETISCGSGSAGVISPYVVSVLDGLKNHFSDVTYSEAFNQQVVVEADTVVIVVGEMVGEGADRKDMSLDERQTELIKSVSSAASEIGKKVLVVLNTPGPVEMVDWLDDVDSVLYIGFAGQESGNALAEIVKGSVNPSGRLTATFPVRYRDSYSSLTFPGEFNRHYYGEGIFVGYRYYDKKDLQVQYPFGFGLSYSKYDYKAFETDKDAIDLDAGETVKVKVLVKNTGDMAGKEVVQLYLADKESTLQRPVKELKGFGKVSLEAGEEKWVSMALDKQSFAVYDESLGQWVVEPGEFEIHIGRDYQTIELSKTIEVTCENPYRISLDTPISEIVKDAELTAQIRAALPEGAMDIAGIAIELIFHPELSIGECIEKYMVKEYSWSKETLESYRSKVLSIIEGI